MPDTLGRAKRWGLSLLVGVAAFVALRWLQSSGETGLLGPDPLYGGLAGLSLTIAASLLLAHLVFWWWAADQGEWAAAGFGGLAGLVFFLAVLDPTWVNPRNSEWLEQGPPGWQTAQDAWMTFHSDVGDNSFLFNREGRKRIGELVLANGAIPLLALPARALSTQPSEPFQYFGAWLLACYCLQGIFGGLLMRCLTQDPRLQMLGTGFFLLSPILLNSVPYPAAAAHGLLLAGLWLYFRTWGTNRQGWLWIGWLLLLVLSVAVHGQLALMNTLLAIAFLVRVVWIDRTVGVGTGAIRLLLLLGVVGGSGFALGYGHGASLTGLDAGLADGGSGAAMNLVAPLDPAGWSQLLQPWPLPAEQSALGFNYLGAGVLLLSAWCLLMVLMRPLDPKGIQPWTPLLVLAGVLTLLSLLPQVAVGSFVLFDLNGKVPDSVQVWMGATGRFFWLVAYAFLFLLIALLVHAHPARRALLLLAFALTLQAADLHGVHSSATSQPPVAGETRGPTEPPEPLPVSSPLRIPWSR